MIRTSSPYQRKMMMLSSSSISGISVAIVITISLLLLMVINNNTYNNCKKVGSIQLLVNGFPFQTITIRPSFLIYNNPNQQQQQNPIHYYYSTSKKQLTTRLYSLKSTNNNTRSSSSTTVSETVIAAPVQQQQPTIFNGKRIVPYKIVNSALKSFSTTKVPAVYAIINSTYSTTTNTNDGWDCIEYIGITQDFNVAITKLYDTFGPTKVAYVRAITYEEAEPLAMQELIQQWKQQVQTIPSNLQENDITWSNLVVDALSYVYDNDDDEDEDDEDTASILEDMAMASQAMASYADSKNTSPSNDESTTTVISPFEQASESTTGDNNNTNNNNILEFNKDNVDAILNEVRPYLIADGGNVAVVNVDTKLNNVYLQLQGACGSCPSSTVTMKMGIERILREKYPNLNEIIQVTDEPTVDSDIDTKYIAVQNELNRLRPAINGMGCTMELISIDNDMGIITMKFNGSKKVRQGLELALLDLVFINEVQFIE